MLSLWSNRLKALKGAGEAHYSIQIKMAYLQWYDRFLRDQAAKPSVDSGKFQA